MKYSIIILAGFILFVACDPRANTFDPNPVLIIGQVSNPRDSINIGDTVKILLEVPDTINYNGTNVVTIIGNGDAANIPIRLWRIDHLSAGSIGNADTCRNIVTTLGSYNNYDVVTFQKINNKLKAEIGFIPTKKGVYFLEETEYGYLGINNKSLNLRFTFNYGTINRNHQMLIDSAGTSSNFNSYIQDHVNRRLEIYGFNVK